MEVLLYGGPLSGETKNIPADLVISGRVHFPVPRERSAIVSADYFGADDEAFKAAEYEANPPGSTRFFYVK